MAGTTASALTGARARRQARGRLHLSYKHTNTNTFGPGAFGPCAFGPRAFKLALQDTCTSRHSHSETLALRDILTHTPNQDALQSFNTVMSLKSLNLGLSCSSHPHVLKVSQPAMQSLLKVDITTH